MIYLLNSSLTQNVKSTLVRWSKNRHDVGGFVAINVMQKLTLRQFSTSTYAQFEVNANYKEKTTEVNNFILAESGFVTAKNWMQQDMKIDKLKYFFLDEVGSLEIDDLGHHQLVRHIIQQDNSNQIFFFLVRQPLLELVMDKYDFHDKKVLELKQIIG